MFLLLLIPLALSIEELSFSSHSVERFDVQFESGAVDIDKEYFLFQGSTYNSSHAYFCRKGKQYELTLIDGDSHEIYTAPAVDARFTFSWPDYSINNVQMTLVLFQGALGTLDMNSYHFLSSVLSFTSLGTSDQHNSTFEPGLSVSSCEKTCNYYYLIIPFVICILGSRYELFLKLFEERYGPPVEMDEPIETRV